MKRHAARFLGRNAVPEDNGTHNKHTVTMSREDLQRLERAGRRRWLVALAKGALGLGLAAALAAAGVITVQSVGAHCAHVLAAPSSCKRPYRSCSGLLTS